MTARTFVVPALLSLVGLVGCGGDDKTTEDGTTQLGIYALPMQAIRTTTVMPDWKDIEKKLEELRLNQANVLDFVPLPGMYKVNETLVHIDECGVDPSGFVPIDHGIRNINKRSGVYLTDYIDAGEVFDTLGCELSGHTYRCDSSASVIDFGLFGMDARVTIQNDDFGNWSGSTDSFIGLNPFSVTCVGADCDQEPASNLFGFITNPMPCTGLEGQRLLLD